jgi:prepilin peptidase CpaA
MLTAEILRYVVAAGLTGVLVWAAVTDAIWRKIPNVAVLAVMALFVVWAIVGRGEGLAPAVGAAALALVVGYVLFATKVMGGGDAKLFAATTLFAGFAYLPVLVLVTALSGGVMAVVSLASRPRRALVMWNLKGQGDFGRGIPYGVAIAAGGIVMIWGALLGWLKPYQLL